MRRIGIYISFILSAFTLTAHAYTANCAVLPGGSSCNQCFGFSLEQTNRPYDTFVPRSGLTAGQQEWIDLSQSSISGTAHQGASVGPTGNITNQFTLVDHGAGNSSWLWAQMKPGMAITRGSMPATIDYSQPVYSVKFITKSNIKQDGVLSSDRGVTHVECAYYFMKAPATSNCGNGVRELNEQCDDGNQNNLDTCTNKCIFPVCGNGIREGSEQCDDANSNNNDDCSNVCRAPTCGNGIREGSEQCDDGNRINNDRCTTSCLNTSGNPGAACGNGIREGSEQCDDGNLINNDSCSNQCRAVVVDPRCSARVLDNNGSSPLITSVSCSGQPQGRTVIAITRNNMILDTLETNSTQYTFSQPGRYTVHCYPDARDQSNSCTTSVEVGALCGNGVIERGEQCDDGNVISGDSCDRYCRAAGSTCGNGTLERGEECDDGNNNSNDSCTNICQRYTPYTGPRDYLWLIFGSSIFMAGVYMLRRLRSRKS